MDKVAVRKAVGVQYPVTGAPILVTGGGGGRGRGAVGVTRGQRALGALGMLAGAAGALTGQHRSLGGLVQSAISGGAQGSALGRGAGRALTSRARQARADREEGIRQQYAARQAAGDMGMFQGRRRFGRTVGTAGRDPTIMENQMRYVDRERAEAAAQQRAQAQFEAAANRARGADFGAEQAADARRFSTLMDQFGIDRERFDQAAAYGAADRGEEPFRREPREVYVNRPEERPQANVDAAGLPVQVIGPGTPMNALLAPSNPQDTAAGENKRMDDMGNQALIGQGTDTERAETVSGGGMSPEQESAMRAQMQGGQVLVRDAQERADEEEKRQQFPQQSLPNSSSVQGE